MMRKITRELARSGVVERVFTSPETIIESAKLYNTNYIPVTNEHDIRKPPIGRVVCAEVVLQGEAEVVLQGEVEMFEESDHFEILTKGDKSVKIDAEEIKNFQVFANQTFEEDEHIADLYQELRRLGSGEDNQVYREDSIEPISSLIIVLGIFTITGIANGFLSKLGEDIYNKLKLTLKNIFKKKSFKQKENILQFQLFLRSHTDKIVEINIVITNPSENDLDGLFAKVPTMLNTMLLDLPIDDLDICRVVFSYEFNELKLLYMLRSDCVPISLRKSDTH